MFHDFPYTDFHELNLDYLMDLARRSLGIHLEIEGKYLKLVNAAGSDISKLLVSYAETALKDDAGNDITAYVIQGGVTDTALVLTKGDGTVTTITIPYAVKASQDETGRAIRSYVRGVGVTGNQIHVTFGDDTTYNFTVPFATKAKQDENGKELTSYVGSLEVAGDKIIVRDGEGVILTELTVTYAEKARDDVDGDAIKETYATDLVTGTTTVQLRAKTGALLSEITVPYATQALTDVDGNPFLSDYAYNLGTDGNRVTINAHNGAVLNSVTVPFATLSTDASNAVENVEISGDQLIFTTYGGRQFVITVPYAVKANKDHLGNTLAHTYIASAVNDPDTGEISFYAQDGTLIATMIPTVDKAVHDSYNNVIADYVKQILVDSASNYVTVIHGTGVSESLVINYSTHAWKDTNENVIKNTYIASMECIEDVEDGHYKLVCYDGDNPRAELFRIELLAYAAQCDVNGRELTTYVGDVNINNVNQLIIKDGEDNTIREILGTVDTFETTPTAVSYDAQTEIFDITNGSKTAVIAPVDFEEVQP